MAVNDYYRFRFVRLEPVSSERWCSLSQRCLYEHEQRPRYADSPWLLRAARGSGDLRLENNPGSGAAPSACATREAETPCVVHGMLASVCAGVLPDPRFALRGSPQALLSPLAILPRAFASSLLAENKRSVQSAGFVRLP